jgi:hypothetical protein
MTWNEKNQVMNWILFFNVSLTGKIGIKDQRWPEYFDPPT